MGVVFPSKAGCHVNGCGLDSRAGSRLSGCGLDGRAGAPVNGCDMYSLSWSCFVSRLFDEGFVFVFILLWA